jgi:hypothetical protein
MRTTERLRPTDVPERVIQDLAASLKIDPAMALDLIMATGKEIGACVAPTKSFR